MRVEPRESVAFANFGHGMLSWAFLYVLRSPPGWASLVRGVANMPKAAVSPLEGIVEADWYSTGLHIVHKLARPDRWVSYEANEPIAMLVPQRRGDLKAFEPVIQDLDREAAAEYPRWRTKRQALVDKIGTREQGNPIDSSALTHSEAAAWP